MPRPLCLPRRFFNMHFKNQVKMLCNHPTFADFIENAQKGENLVRKKGEHLNIPPWLKNSVPVGKGYFEIGVQLKKSNIATVCQEARCPNIGECWNEKDGNPKTATILILGDTCTRGCRFCSIKTSRKPSLPNPNEPVDAAEAIKSWGVNYIVITCVDRDDLPDGGSMHMVNTVKEVKNRVKNIMVECLVSDYRGNEESIKNVSLCGMEVFAHNIETVKRLQSYVRDPRASYDQSMLVLKKAKEYNPKLYTKSSIMVGLGETFDEVIETMKDLRQIGVEFLTIGQYMQPTSSQTKVKEYIHPELFKQWEKHGLEFGFLYVASGPLVRSSYRAGEFFMKQILKSSTYSK